MSVLLLDVLQNVQSYSHLADELATESVDDTGDGGGLALADEVEVEHTLHGLGLHTAVTTVSLRVPCCSRSLTAIEDPLGRSVDLLDEASRLRMEESVRGERTQRSAWLNKTLNVVVGRQAVAIGAVGGHGEVLAR